MKCPYCGKENTRVIDSRPTDDSSIRRRRQCDECGKRFTTYEKVETLPLIVVKKDNNREPYDREKIVAGIVRSCHKRPISMTQINDMVDDIEGQIFNMGEKEIPTTTIGSIVMDKLKEFGYEPEEICESGIVATIKGNKPGKTFLLRADMDALPMAEAT